MYKRILKWSLILIIAGFSTYLIYFFWIKKSINLNAWSLIPSNALFVLETKQPVDSWKDFCRSDIWNHISTHPYFIEINQNIQGIDSFIRVNEMLFDMLGKREVLIAGIKTKSHDFDFLYIIDLEAVSKIDFFNQALNSTFKLSGYTVSESTLKNQTIFMISQRGADAWFYTIKGNQMIVSFSKKCVELSIENIETNTWTGINCFDEVNSRIDNNGLFRFYVNGNRFDDWMQCYQNPIDNTIKDISNTMCITGLTAQVNKNSFSGSGVVKINDSTPGYFSAMLKNGNGNFEVSSVLSERVAFYQSLSVKDFSSFYTQFETVFKEKPGEFASYMKSRTLAETWLGIDLYEHFINWMEGEVTYMIIPSSNTIHPKDYGLAIKLKDSSLCREKLNVVRRRIKRRTPFSLKTHEYKNYEVNTIITKGLFELMFGKLFSHFEKPYYSILGNYIFFTNTEYAAHLLIDDYTEGKTLGNNTGYLSSQTGLMRQGNLRTYVNTSTLLSLMRESVNQNTWKKIVYNRPYTDAFNHVVFQLNGNESYFSMNYYMSYTSPSEVEKNIIYSDTSDELISFSDTALQTELLNDGRLEVIKDASGQIISECEMLEPGVPHGNYIEYYPGGKRKVKGKYNHGAKTGTWKYYNLEGILVKKEDYYDE